MLVETRQTLRGESELRISIGDEVLSDFNEASYLGLLLSSDLSWFNYILKLCNKLSQKVRVLCRMKSKVPSPLLNVIYKTRDTKLLYNHILITI